MQAVQSNLSKAVTFGLRISDLFRQVNVHLMQIVRDIIMWPACRGDRPTQVTVKAGSTVLKHTAMYTALKYIY